uniref:Short-chain dehydrogenase TIC 32, chloroplastic n=1 Tax=Anthurium amnicola TaxID=1678845 RepID=A0A1D1YA33_9ARAE
MGLSSWIWGPGPSGFGSSSTAEQVTDGIDASQLTAIVTGATSGIGKETARVLALRGAKVIIPARTLEAGAAVKQSLLDGQPDAKIDVMQMDLGSLSSVESFARSFNSSNQPLNLLINNAGIMGCPFQLSRDGVELHFATNHLGHFLLTNLLLDKMKATAKETGIQGRIVNVSSAAHQMSDASWLDLDTINDESKYQAFRRSYSRSKLANILHANELSRRLQEEGVNVTVNSLHPGAIMTNIGRHLELNPVVLSVCLVLKPFLKSVPQGASTTCYLALHPGVKGVSGKYFTDCNEATPISYARDENLAKKLWVLSEELVEKFKRPA